VGWKLFQKQNFWNIGLCTTPNSLYLCMKLWNWLERILCAERRFVMVRANDDFHVLVQYCVLWFNFSVCVEFVLNVLSDLWFKNSENHSWPLSM
jgi:hypothetical protein